MTSRPNAAGPAAIAVTNAAAIGEPRRSATDHPMVERDASRRVPNVLVAYASRFGSTAEVAGAVGERLATLGATCATKHISEVEDVTAYDAVVVGAPIQYDNWKSEARLFVTENARVLSSVPVAFFFTCAALANGSPKAFDKAHAYAQKISAVSGSIDPIGIGQFAGVVDFRPMNLPTRIGLRAILTLTRVDQGDHRDWDAIRSWTDDIARIMLRGQVDSADQALSSLASDRQLLVGGHDEHGDVGRIGMDG